MDIKKQSHLLKSRAKELGYEIKLTHAQELVSTILGHKSRHSALLADKKEKSKLSLQPDDKSLTVPSFSPINKDQYYYYKVTLENNKILYLETIQNIGEDCEFLHIAWRQSLITANERDVLDVINVLEITQLEFLNHTSIVKYYYEIHIVEDMRKDGSGYSIVFESSKNITQDDEVIKEAMSLGHIDAEDSKYVDYTDTLDKSTYLKMRGF